MLQNIGGWLYDYMLIEQGDSWKTKLIAYIEVMIFT